MGPKEIIARRVAKELKDEDFVNLGFGIPTLVSNYIPEGIEVSSKVKTVFLVLVS